MVVVGSAAIAATSCGGGGPAVDVVPGQPTSDAVVVTTGSDPRAPVVIGSEVLLPAIDFTATTNFRPATPLSGWMSSAAAVSPDGDTLAINSIAGRREVNPHLPLSMQGVEPGDSLGTPTLSLLDLATGRETVLVSGAESFAWRRDGALAFVDANQPEIRVGERYVGQIVVADHLPPATTTQWTVEAERYTVAAWAGDTLVAYEWAEGDHVELLTLDGPGAVRRLGANASLVAVSPEGDRLFVEQDRAVRVVAVGTGETLATLDLTSATPPLDGVSYSGSWKDDLVAASSQGGVAFFEVDRETDRIALVEELAFEKHFRGNAIAEPELVDAKSRTFVAWARIDPTEQGKLATFVLIQCAGLSRTCVRGPEHDTTVRIIRSASRPS